MSIDEDWLLFQSYGDRGSAESTCARLRFEGVPARIEPRSLERGVEARFDVMVSASLAHRARWVVAQLPPSDAELNFLATGKLSDSP